MSRARSAATSRRRAGSTHGYDIVDPTRINPELGGEPALQRLVAAPVSYTHLTLPTN